jgi:hypothetical protein
MNISACLTSCNRFNLLERTLDSFFKLNTYPIQKFYIIEDSTKLEMKEKIISKYGDKVELIFNDINLGPYKSIDKVYNLIDTEYIFHCEDDWSFDSNPNFIKESISILEERKDIHQIWFRKDADSSWIESNEQNVNGVSFKMLKVPHCGDWNGFSLNPHVKRLSDYKLMFPNGYQEFILKDKSIVFTEHNCMRNADKFNYRAALLNNRCCQHIGHGQSTYA